ncbi:MAG: tRNA lysidine(34) synthetase TilS, partial [Magnetococcales bacterium]|nr:tRNA lysidine(34) synthetase TilS [Magnetococcales bacterium]
MAIDPLVQRLRREANPLFCHQPNTVLGLSGGGDSMALLHLLLASGLLPRERLTVAHFNHNLRADAHMDVQFTREIARKLQLNYTTTTWTAPHGAGNLPALARAARYGFLVETARRVAAPLLATAHHMDDQAETFLERLARGSGARGLGAMAPSRPLTPEVTLVRPLLCFRHQELLHWLTRREIPWMEDPSNHNPHFLRARIRGQLLPCLQAALHRDPTPQLAETARRMAHTHDALEWSLD